MPDFTFDKKRRLYFRDGRPVRPSVVRQWAAEVRERTREQMAKVTQQYIEGGNRAEWTLQMRALISRSHSAVWMLAQGGREAMDAKSWGAVGNKIKSEARYLRGFEIDIANDVAGSEAQILARAQLYANALHATYEGAIIFREKAAGVTRVLRVLGQPTTSHCSECPDLAGEYNIEDVPMPGEQECNSACYCTIEPVELEVAA